MRVGMKLLIADDHSIVRAGVKQLLSDSDYVTTVGEAGSAAETIDKIRSEDWQLVLLDISMPDKNGLEVLKQIKSERPKLPVLIYSMHTEDQYALRALKAGASGYLSKSSPPAQLLEAIRKITAGQKYITQTVAEKLASIFDTSVTEYPHELLTDRELQIFCAIACGQKLSEIATRLSLSSKTISAHRGRILKKMAMKSNADIIIYALKHKLCGSD